MRVELYEDKSNSWRWRAVDSMNRIIAKGADSYTSRDDVEQAVDTVVNEFRGALQVVSRERRTTVRDENVTSTPYEIHVVAEYMAEGDHPKEHA